MLLGEARKPDRGFSGAGARSFAIRRLLGASLVVLLLAGGCAERGSPPSLEIADFVLESSGHPRRHVHLPTHLDDGRVPNRDGLYTLSARVSLPPSLRDHALDFVILHFWAATRLEVDGRDAVRVRGQSGDAYRQVGPHVFRIPAEATRDGYVDLRLSVEHRWSQSAWLDVVPRIHLADRPDVHERVVTFFNVHVSQWAFAGLVNIGVVCLAIFAVDRRRKAYWWFGVQALAAGAYPAFVLGYSEELFGRYDGFFTEVSVIVAVWASFNFLNELFDLGPLERGWHVAAATAASSAFVLPASFFTVRLGAAAAAGAVLVGFLVQSTRSVRVAKTHPDSYSARWFLACWLALGLTTWTDFQAWLGLGDVAFGARIGCAGLLAFSLFLSLLLSRRHIYSLTRSDALNEELVSRIGQLERHGRQIELLNRELRRQIESRSEQIYAALLLRDSVDGAAFEAPTLVPGQTVLGRYEVHGKLGHGGMGAVYEVARLDDGTRLALKVSTTKKRELFGVLAREAQIASRIDHPNVVRIVDVDISPPGFLFLVMELVRGKNLVAHAHRFGDEAWALRVLEQLASGLVALHGCGVVHRDLKPENILVTEGTEGDPGLVKITDFGVSRLAEPEVASEAETRAIRRPATAHGTEVAGPDSERPSVDGPMTRMDAIAGTPAYMAPEVARSVSLATPASDSYSFGVLAWELLTGRRPTVRPAALDVLDGIEPLPAPSLAIAWRGGDPELIRLVDACLSLEPEERPAAATIERELRWHPSRARGLDARATP